MSDGTSRPPEAAASCTLLVGDRVIVRGTAPPEAEFAMFEIGEIELRASEHGRVREHGYQTTAGRARARLANLGLTPALARAVAEAMQPVLTDAYARGVAVRNVARYLGPAEMFQSDDYDGSARRYHGVFLDLAALARDIGVDHASATIQALYLAAILENEPDETTVLLSTDGCTKDSKPGARTYKRPSFSDPKRLFNALGGLAHKAPKPDVRDVLLRADVIAFLRSRADAAPDADTRALYKSLEGIVSLRDMPEKGPLASPDLWSIETRIESGDVDGIDDAIDEAERRHGRTPGTTYLRARVALALRREPPKRIAERVSALALSMTSFRELALLAAESWLDAGDPRRAMPYARDLVDSPGIEEGLLLRAQRLLARADGTAPALKQTLVDSLHAGPLPSRPPPGLTADIAVVPPVVDAPKHISAPPPPPAASVPLSPPSSHTSDPPAPRPLGRSQRPAAAEVLPHAPPPIELDLPPAADPAASFTLDLPGPEALSKARSSAPPGGGARPSRRPRSSGVVVETRPPASFDPRAEPSSPIEPRTSPLPEGRRESMPSPRSGPAPARRASIVAKPASSVTRLGHEHPTPPAGRVRTVKIPPLGAPPKLPSEAPFPVAPNFGAAAARASAMPAPTPFMHSASLPPYQLESPAPLLPKAPLLPRLGGDLDELAERLPLPPGVENEPVALDALPTSVLEARVQFTLLARELGLAFRREHGIELRADVSGIEAMQSVLLESFPDHVVRTSGEAFELRRYGALLSEILARRLDAEWLDISPSDLGHWAMIVPPNTRVWPFGRIVRLIAMGHKERDLVSYFFELSVRARGR